MVRRGPAGWVSRRGSTRSSAGAASASAEPVTASGETSDTRKTGTPTNMAPPPQGGSSSTVGRGGATARAARGATTGRFRPRIVRRDEAQRESMVREEEEKVQKQIAEEKRARGRSRLRSKRSRGDAMGRRGRGTISGVASGPFSGEQNAPGRSGGGGWGGGGGGGGGGSSSRDFKGSIRVKSDAKPGIATADGGNRPRDRRINADKLHTTGPDEELDSEGEDLLESMASRAGSMLPVGIYRREHKDEGIVVATTAELEAAENNTREEESLWVEGDAPEDEVPPVQSRKGGIWDDADVEPKIKKEPDLDDDVEMGEEELDAPKPSVKLEKKTRAKAGTKAGKKKVPLKKPIPRDSEDLRIQSDLHLLASELGAVTVNEANEPAEPVNKEGRMYLFQFPPLLPPLQVLSQPEPMAPSRVKEEPNDTNMMDAPLADSRPVDLTRDEANGAQHANGGVGGAGDDDLASPPKDPGGMVGTLKVRKSGRVELDWGGRVMDMSTATSMNFLTTAVIVEEYDQKPEPGVVTGDGIGMGKIMGRFVAAPTWDEEEDWDVPLEELNAVAA